MEIRLPRWKDTHERVLRYAVRVAAREGLGGLSIDGLAEKVEMSKSGLYAHFSSKHQLQLSTVEAAWAIFTQEALPTARQSSKGLSRVLAFCETYLCRDEPRVFSGAVLFGVIADSVVLQQSRLLKVITAIQDQWLRDLEALIREAVDMGDLNCDTDAVGLAFELNALLFAANSAFILRADSTSLNRARAAINARLVNRRH
ncbi:TetR/AcrR family transcriptional regulator [Mycobacteroides abscessus subsp. bolletii]|uniref:TetR/AcrR family transcriptional regulator n=1 Tax=Mycobacteroides abscessus TaxID=36809 RepID=UPI0019D247A4|nr:TetR/AcrR family transcriptional regulator [Mycobacteroides abscessus]MBN7303117.1 TetR/AcrR family transcriptional regulator [Mycobacteroides abscessus subsp. bolletii]